MQWYSEWIYGMNTESKFMLFSLWIILFLSLQYTSASWLRTDIFVSLIVASIFMYIVYQQWIYTNYSTLEQLNNQLIQINIDKYPNLQTDLNVVRILLDLKPMMKVDRIKYTELVETIDAFFKSYNQLGNIHYEMSYIYTDCYDSARKALNILKNFVFNSPVYPKLKETREITSSHTFIIPEIDTYGDILKQIFSKYLDEIEMKVNKEWKKGNINILSKPVVSDQPDGVDPYRDDHYDIY